MERFLFLKVNLFVYTSDCLNYKANGDLGYHMSGIFYLRSDPLLRLLMSLFHPLPTH